MKSFYDFFEGFTRKPLYEDFTCKPLYEIGPRRFPKLSRIFNLQSSSSLSNPPLEPVSKNRSCEQNVNPAINRKVHVKAMPNV